MNSPLGPSMGLGAAKEELLPRGKDGCIEELRHLEQEQSGNRHISPLLFFMFCCLFPLGGLLVTRFLACEDRNGFCSYFDALGDRFY